MELNEQDREDLTTALDLILNTDEYQNGNGEDYDTNIHRAAHAVHQVLMGETWFS